MGEKFFLHEEDPKKLDGWMDGWIYSTLPSARTPKIQDRKSDATAEDFCRRLQSGLGSC